MTDEFAIVKLDYSELGYSELGYNELGYYIPR
jgi:hypothetical protein